MRPLPGLARRKPCPICQKPSDPKHHPFCSNRCREVDLSRWLKGNYAIPAADQSGDDEGDGV
jgi:uncharacterized protein